VVCAGAELRRQRGVRRHGRAGAERAARPVHGEHRRRGDEVADAQVPAQRAAGPDADQTASALAELCAVGASAMTRFIGAALSLEELPSERERERERRTDPPPSMRRSVIPGGMP